MTDTNAGDGVPSEHDGRGAREDERTDVPPGDGGTGPSRPGSGPAGDEAAPSSNGHGSNGHHRPPTWKRVAAWPGAREQRTGDYSAYVPVKERVALLIFAVVTAAVLVAVLRYAVGFSSRVAMAFGVAAFVCTALTNWIHTSGLSRPRGFDLVRVVLSSAVFGFVLAVVVTPYLFEKDVVALHFAEIDDLQREVASLVADIENPQRPNVDDDPTVAPALRNRNAVKERYEKAVDALLCELDGSCGTGRSGQGPVSGSRQAEVDRLVDELRAAETELGEARSAARTRVNLAVVQTTEEATAVLADRRTKLIGLRVERALVDGGKKELSFGVHMQTLPELFTRRPVGAPVALLGIVVFYVLVHYIPLSFPPHDERERARARKRAAAAEQSARRHAETSR